MYEYNVITIQVILDWICTKTNGGRKCWNNAKLLRAVTAITRYLEQWKVGKMTYDS